MRELSEQYDVSELAQIISAIISRGNDAEIRASKDGIKVIEVSKSVVNIEKTAK